VSEERVAILGGGKMGESLLSGLLRSSDRTPEGLMVSCRREDRAKELADVYGVATTLDNAEAVGWSRTLVLTVKPQDMDALLAQIAGSVAPEHLVVTVAAGIRCAFIERRLPVQLPVVRVMSNVAVQLDLAMSVVSPGALAGDEHLAVAEGLFGAVGKVIRLAESDLDAVTAISGSGPAYFALLAEAMIDACSLLGLSRDVATELILQTMLGSARMLQDLHRHPVELREMVTSPGGTTIAAIRELEKAGVRAAFLSAIAAAAERSAELAKGAEAEDI
jgi:pyrroline-5-carboxylate reductase